MYAELEKILPRDSFSFDEPLKKHTTFRIGGPADVLAAPREDAQLLALLAYIRSAGLRSVIIGNGSNVLFPDRGFRGIVIKLGAEFSGVTLHEEDDETVTLHARAGTLLSRLANTACEAGLGGLEFAAGIPGSVGGAVLMNAGAYDGEISQLVFKSTYIDAQRLSVSVKTGAAHAFAYRCSSYQEDHGVILSADFRLQRRDKAEILMKMKELNARRLAKQPLEYPSAGSAFKRPQGFYAGKLIEECGLKGYSCGGARVSEKHCGFIVNTGGATCEDVLHVIEYIRKTVFEQKGVMLEPEIKIIEG